jgi:hypothetical protein
VFGWISFTKNRFHEYNSPAAFHRIPDRWIGVPPRVNRNRYNSTLGDPFKKTGTPLADPLLSLLDILVARFPTLSETVDASTRLWVR